MKQVKSFLVYLLLFGAVLRLAVAYLTVHHFDLSFYYDWATGAAADFFRAYEIIPNLDYPPLFLFPLYLTGHLLQLDAVRAYPPFEMIVLKGWQIAGDLVVVLLIYLILRKHPFAAAGGAALWAVNPAAIVNSAYWGQTDSIMIAFLLASFWMLEEGHPEASGILIAFGCLMKFQTIYFVPLFALGLVCRFHYRQILRTILAAAAVGIGVFFPFLLYSGWDLPFRIYFGGFQSYPGAVLNGFNLYGALGLNFTHVNAPFAGYLTIDMFSYLMLFLIFIALAYCYLTATEKSFWLLGFLLIQSVFIFTARMHERYQIPALAFGLIACIVHKSRPLAAGIAGLTLMVFLNQFLVLDKAFHPQLEPYFQVIMQALSWGNLLLYGLTAMASLHILYHQGRLAFPFSFRRFALR